MNFTSIAVYYFTKPLEYITSILRCWSHSIRMVATERPSGVKSREGGGLSAHLQCAISVILSAGKPALSSYLLGAYKIQNG